MFLVLRLGYILRSILISRHTTVFSVLYPCGLKVVWVLKKLPYTVL